MLLRPNRTVGSVCCLIRDGSIPGFTVISALVLNAILGFGLLWIACKVYNWVAEKFGGIGLALKELPEETDDIQQ